MCVSGRFFESPSSFWLGPAKRGIPGAVSKEALLMRENKPQRHTSENRSPCEINHLFEGHALEVKLEGQISCWGEMLFHIELWSREAARREREDVVELLEDQRAEATSARQRAYEDLDVLRRTETPWEPRRGPPPTRSSLLLLPPGGARPLFRGLRRLRRR